MAKKKDERSMDEITDAILLNDEPGIDVTDDEDALIDELAALIDGDDDDEPIEKGYAPGKNPNSHKKGGLSNRRAGAHNQLTDRDKKLKYGGAMIQSSKKQLRLARKAKEAGHAGRASHHAYQARRILRLARVGDATDIKAVTAAETKSGREIKVTPGNRAYSAAQDMGNERNAHMKAARRKGISWGQKADLVEGAREANRVYRGLRNKARVTKSQPGPGDVHASGADPKAGHMAGCRCKDCRKKVAKGYAVGKNPNSHKKRQSANRGDKLPKGTPIQDQANRALRSARKALDAGDKGKASHYAHEARTITRAMRGRVKTGPSGGGIIDNTGIKQTEGDKAHNRARWNENAVKANMKAARSETGETRSASVRRARGANRQGRKFRAISRVTKRFEIPVKIQKADKKEQIVYGWASPVSEFGTSIIDKQGDVLDIDDVRKAAHDFMLNSRSGGSMHKDIGIDKASVVESVVLSTELQKALGIDMPYEGWFIGVKIHDNAVWKKIEDGEYTGFSIGGSGVREAMEEAVEKKSMYGPGKNPNSHKRKGNGVNMTPMVPRSKRGGNAKGSLANRTGNTAFTARDSKVSAAARSQNSASRRLFTAKESLVAAREAKKSGNLGEASMHAREARMNVRMARQRGVADLKLTVGAHAAEMARLGTGVKNDLMAGARRNKNKYDRASLVRSARANAKTARKWTNVARVNKGMYGPGKNPNSHKRNGRARAFESVMRGNPASPRNSAAVGKVKQHLNESKNWLDEARAVRDHDPKQAAYAAQQARKELRRARGSSTKTDSGKSLQARRARSFARQSRDERD